MSESDTLSVRFDRDGLIPVVVQETDGDVLMLAFMNEEALRLTRETGRAHYWSRSRGKLWRKGETSGNEQFVEAVRINCELNSLLLVVRQSGAVCHDGYDTCYYRELATDGSLTVVMPRAFDPVEVYGEATTLGRTSSVLTDATRLQFGAYEYLRDHDVEGQSRTSRLLRGANSDLDLEGRIADELGELAGVLDGTHEHDDPSSDLVLEASQVIYWIYLMTISNGEEWCDLRPDRALATGVGEAGLVRSTVARMVQAQAHRWRSGPEPAETRVALAHETLALVGQACLTGGVEPLAAVQADLDELRTRSYLGPYFALADRAA